MPTLWHLAHWRSSALSFSVGNGVTDSILTATAPFSIKVQSDTRWTLALEVSINSDIPMRYTGKQRIGVLVCLYDEKGHEAYWTG